MKRFLTLAVVVAAVILAGCAKESKFPSPTGKGSIQAINAIPRSPEFNFLIEEARVGSAQFQSATGAAQYDDFEYNFNFDTILAGDSTLTRVATQVLEVVKDTAYTFIISGDFTAPDIVVWETPLREWNETDTVLEVRAAHLATTQGLLDIYIADEMTPPQLGSQFATIGLGEVAPAVDLTAGDYVLTVTPAGDDSTILFSSDPITLSAQAQPTFSIFDPDRNDAATVAASIVNHTTGTSFQLIDSRFPPTIRFIHASLNFGNADIYTDDPLTTPIVTNHAFAEITGFYDIVRGINPITYTAPGDTGTLLFDVEHTVGQGTKVDFYVVPTTSGTDITVGHATDRRAVDTRARLGIINAAAGRDAVDVYMVPSGELIDEATPFLPGLPLSQGPFSVPVAPASYDLYITDVDEKVALAGPIPFVPDFGDFFQVMILENVQPTEVDLVFIPQP